MLGAPDTQVLVAGAGPIELAAAIELTRLGIGCPIVDPLLEPPQDAKAVGVQPRTLAITGHDAPGLLDSYGAEQPPVSTRPPC